MIRQFRCTPTNSHEGRIGHVAERGRYWLNATGPGDDPVAPQLSELHYRSADDAVTSEEVQIFVDLFEADSLDGMLDLSFGGERHDLAEICVVTPEGPMKGLLSRHSREQRDVDAIADEADIRVVATDPQQCKSHLHHLWRANTINDRIELVLIGCLLQFFADIVGRLALDTDDVVGAIFLCNREFVRIAGECDDGRASAE